MKAASSEPFDPFYTLKEVEAIIRVSRSTAYKLVRSGDLPAVKRGGRILVAKSALENFIASLMRAMLSAS